MVAISKIHHGRHTCDKCKHRFSCSLYTNVFKNVYVCQSPKTLFFSETINLYILNLPTSYLLTGVSLALV